MSEGIGFGRRKLIEKIINTNWGISDPTKYKYNFHHLMFVIQEMLTDEGKAYQEDNLKRGHRIFTEFVKYLIYRNMANFDSMLLLTSEKGGGKSSAAIVIARLWCKLLGIPFSPKRHIAYNNADMMNKIDELNAWEPIIADESVRFAQSADWAKRENKELKKKLAQVRTKHLLFILCFPLKINKVEKNFLESFTNYWIDLFSRGIGAIFVKDRNPVHDSWRLQSFKDLGSYSEFTPSQYVEKVLKRHPNFWNIIKFPKPPDWLYEKYLKVREHNVYDNDTVLSSVSKEDIHNALLVLTLRDIMLHDTTLSLNRIILHIKNNYDLNIPKSFVEMAIEDAKQLIMKVREMGVEHFEKREQEKLNNG